jgi:hypothetical protein
MNYTAQEVQAAFTQAGIEVADTKTGAELLPPEFGQPDITLITAGIRDPTSQVVYRSASKHSSIPQRRMHRPR